MSKQEGKGESPDEKSSGEDQSLRQVQMSSVTARVPPSIGHGVMSTGAIVMNGPHGFVLDFLQQMGIPHHLVSRVFLPHAVVPGFIKALEDNLALYDQKFGPPREPAKATSQAATEVATNTATEAATNAAQPSAQDLYDNLKIPDEELNGHFADAVMIRHSMAVFGFDFVTHFFPHAAVSSRVFLAAPHVPPLLAALKSNYENFQRALAKQQGRAPPTEPPHDPT